MRLRALLAIVFGALSIAAASDPAERLPDPAQEAKAREIFRDVRCLVCQNESIDDSEADLAKDLRKLVREQVAAGKSEDQVKQFLTDRYGEFVLLTPSFNAWNLALWIGPFLVVLAGVFLLMRRLGGRATEAELSQDEARRLEKLTDPETR
ncbi:cytochrome c-type biogenesis protein [Phenylobacterium sp. VNQ135]|uniref:cytochrome c-type biogenesis protein n=1 Tax=Phenylobacterium sp. VNQ135 TaxID=3400922 RepID=UPI003BFE9D0D